MGHERIPFGDRELGIAGCKAGAEVVLPCLDVSFGGVAAMAVRRDSLEVNIASLEGLFELIGAFIVEDVQFWCMAICLEFFLQFCPAVGKLAAGLPTL